MYYVIAFWLVLFRRFTKQKRLVGWNKILIDLMSLNSIDSVVIQIKNITKLNRLLHSRQMFHRSGLQSQVGFAEFNNTADNRANIGGTIIGAPIVGQ